MIVTEKEMEEIQKHFPDIDLNNAKSKILGELSFSAKYDGEKLHLNPAERTNYKVFKGYYEIEIRLNELDVYRLPKVFETSDKIRRFSKENHIHPIDLHLNRDFSCCLGIFLPMEAANMSLYSFIVEYVFSFFAWQAYRSTFMQKPPWGEYSHDRGPIEKLEEIKKATGRNDLCPCGSGKKFKICCLDKYMQFNRSIN